MSVVAIPFKDEDLRVLRDNIETAASHPRVDAVWAVGSAPGLEADLAAIGTKVELIADERIGSKRPGKGDAMNTALRRASNDGVDRVHFYDADIFNFDSSWIDGAEAAADQGFDVVRHTFPRAATDAMITWFVTRPVLAMKYPGTVLPRIGQPLGGEILLQRPAIEAIAGSDAVRHRSDWGIDTVITHGIVDAGFSLYEHHVASGKQHVLYGSLADLETMLVECLDAVLGLPARQPAASGHFRDPDAPVPSSMKETTAYDFDESEKLLTVSASSEDESLVDGLPDRLRSAIVPAIELGDYSGMDDDAWWHFLLHARAEFDLGDPPWRRLAFRAWVARVLHYTARFASAGYDPAIAYLEGTIADYERRAVELTS